MSSNDFTVTLPCRRVIGMIDKRLGDMRQYNSIKHTEFLETEKEVEREFEEASAKFDFYYSRCETTHNRIERYKQEHPWIYALTGLSFFKSSIDDITKIIDVISNNRTNNYSFFNGLYHNVWIQTLPTNSSSPCWKTKRSKQWFLNSGKVLVLRLECHYHLRNPPMPKTYDELVKLQTMLYKLLDNKDAVITISQTTFQMLTDENVTTNIGVGGGGGGGGAGGTGYYGDIVDNTSTSIKMQL